MRRPTVGELKREINVKTSRSSGPGGQHANKVETRVVLRWNINESIVLDDLQKEMLRSRLGNILTRDGEIIVSADSKRSQLRNKESAFKKLDRLLSKAFTEKKKRLATKPGKASKKKRLDEKRKQSEKKEMRRRII